MHLGHGLYMAPDRSEPTPIATNKTDEPDSEKTESRKAGALRTVGLGIITGASDDDPAAVGTYAAAGASLGPAALWTAPAAYPMMFAVVYLSSKLGQVSGKGLFDAIRDHFPAWVLWPTLIGVLIGNTIEAAADLGGMAAALNIFVPVPVEWLVIVIAVIVMALLVWGSYKLVRNVFRWLTLALFAYVIAAILAKPELGPVIAGTLIPKVEWNREFLSLLVAIIGTSLSAYLYTWQSNMEVEEEIAKGRTRLWQRQGATTYELKQSRKDILIGMFFANLVMYFVMLATSATLFKAGQHEITSAAQAAEALRPVAGDAAGLLFALGVVGVGFLAIPIMTVGAAYDLCQVMGWQHGLNARVGKARKFYVAIAGFTACGVGLNFLGINPMQALVFSGIVQGFSTPPLMLMIMLLTGSRKVMGDKANGLGINILGWFTTAALFAASIALVVTLFV